MGLQHADVGQTAYRTDKGCPGGASCHIPTEGPAPDAQTWQGSPTPVNWILPLVYPGLIQSAPPSLPSPSHVLLECPCMLLSLDSGTSIIALQIKGTPGNCSSMELLSGWKTSLRVGGVGGTVVHGTLPMDRASSRHLSFPLPTDPVALLLG